MQIGNPQEIADIFAWLEGMEGDVRQALCKTFQSLAIGAVSADHELDVRPLGQGPRSLNDDVEALLVRDVSGIERDELPLQVPLFPKVPPTVRFAMIGPVS